MFTVTAVLVWYCALRLLMMSIHSLVMAHAIIPKKARDPNIPNQLCASSMSMHIIYMEAHKALSICMADMK